MSNVTFTNHEWLARSFDKNNNQVMDELQFDPTIKTAVDTDGNGQVSRGELVSALQSDAVEISEGTVIKGKGIELFVHGLETLKSVHNTAKNARSNASVWAPTFYEEDTGAERYDKLVRSNRTYESAINSMESALRSIRDMTSNANDATSRALHIQAKTTLNSASWRTWVGSFQDIMNDGQVTRDNIRRLESANTNLQAAYETLNVTMKSITEQTRDLPDMEGAFKATDATIARAFSNLTGIQQDVQTASQVSDKLNRIADSKREQATGRALPWAGVGAGIGAVGGGLIGFFAGGKTVKSALIGVGVGTAVSAGIGGLAGHLTDMKYLGEAEALEKLSGKVSRYQVAPNQQKLMEETKNTYNILLDARSKHDLDNARVIKNEFTNIHGRVKPIETESAEILQAYKMHE